MFIVARRSNSVAGRIAIVPDFTVAAGHTVTPAQFADKAADLTTETGNQYFVLPVEIPAEIPQTETVTA